MSFLCICPEKSLQLGDDEHLHRNDREQFVNKFLETYQFAGSESRKMALCLPGGGMVIDTPGQKKKLAQDGPFIAAITGSIQNYAYLVKKYLQEELGLPANITLEAIKERNPISEPILLCRLYSMLGTGMLSKLRGHFSICLYDSTTVRVLAARDPSGLVPLYHGHLANNALFVTSNAAPLADVGDVFEILPGNYKYGWRAAPRKYANPETVVKSSAAAASHAALAALTGIPRKCPASAAEAQRRASFDVTRADSRKNGEENRRQSMDWHKMSSRADEHGWWRSKEEPGFHEDGSPRWSSGDSDRSRNGHRCTKTGSESAAAKSITQSPRDSISTTDSAIVEKLINQLGGAFLEDSASTRMMRSLLSHSPCSLVVTDARHGDDPIVFVNKSFEEQTGYALEEVIGRNCRFMQAVPLAAHVPSSASVAIRRGLEAGRSVNARILNYRKDGSPMWNELSVVPLRSADGAATHHVGMQTFSSAADGGVTLSPESLEGKQAGIIRSRSCSDVMKVVSGQMAATAPNLAF